MQRTIPSRAAAACGAVFAVALTVATGTGESYSPGRYVAARWLTRALSSAPSRWAATSQPP